MQAPTCTGLHIRSPEDARTVFHAVHQKIRPMVVRRLDTDERQSIRSGHVYVWEERGPNTELTGIGIERWTDGIRWGPSRVRDGFLFYEEKRDRTPYSETPYNMDNISMSKSDQMLLHKQTYTVWVETANGRRKWHLIAYYTEANISYLKDVKDFPDLASLRVPHANYPSARHPKGRPEHIFNYASATKVDTHVPMHYSSYSPENPSPLNCHSPPAGYHSQQMTPIESPHLMMPWSGHQPPRSNAPRVDQRGFDHSARYQQLMDNQAGRLYQERPGLAPLESSRVPFPANRWQEDDDL